MFHSQSRRTRRIATAAVLAAAAAVFTAGPATPLEAASAVAEHLPEPGRWSLVPGTAFRDSGVVTSEAEAKAKAIRGVIGVRGVLDAWSGAGWDADGQCLYFMGGGHADYGGNEVYRLCADTLRWERLTAPYPLDGSRPVEMTHDADGDGTMDACPVPEGQPFAAHTYDALEVIDGVLYTAADEPYCTTAQPRTPRLFAAPVAALEREGGAAWERMPDPPVAAGNHSARNPHTGNLVVYGRGRNIGIAEFDPAQREWVTAMNQSVAFMPRGGVCITLPDDILCNVGQAVMHTRFGPGQLVDRLYDRIALDRAALMHADACLAWHPGRDSIVVFPGGRTVYEIPRAGLGQRPGAETTVREWRMPGPAPGDGDADETAYVSSKCAYLPQHDVFLMVRDSGTDVALYRLPEEGTEPLRLTVVDDGVHHVCPLEDLGREGCEYDSLAAAVEAAAPGDRVELAPGTYGECARIDKPLTLRGGHLTGRACGGKAALVVTAGPTRIENLECSGIAVGDGNGACVRWEAGALTLSNVTFRDSQSGVLGTSRDDGLGPLLIEGSTFTRLGGECSRACGQAHGIYIEGAPSVTIRNSRFTAGREEGYEIKSGVAELIIEDSVVDSADGEDSRLIDAYNGGRLVIRRSVLREGPRSANSDVIGYAMEMRRDFADNTVILEDNEIHCDGAPVMNARKVEPRLEMRGNRTSECR